MSKAVLTPAPPARRTSPGLCTERSAPLGSTKTSWLHCVTLKALLYSNITQKTPGVNLQKTPQALISDLIYPAAYVYIYI